MPLIPPGYTVRRLQPGDVIRLAPGDSPKVVTRVTPAAAYYRGKERRVREAIDPGTGEPIVEERTTFGYISATSCIELLAENADIG